MYQTAQLVIDGSNTTPGQVTIFENKHFRTGEREHCVQVNTINPVLIRTCTALTSGDFCRAVGGAQVTLEDNYIRGRIPATKDYSAGLAFRGDYLKGFAARRNIVRELGGLLLGQWRGKKKAEGGMPTDISGNVFYNLHRKRSDGAGGTLATTTIVSNHKEGSTRGRSDPNQTAGFTLPIGWEFAQALVVNCAGNKQDNLPAAFFGGLEFVGNMAIQEPGRGLAEDLFNFYLAGGESWDAPLAVRGWFVLGNYGNGINAQGQLWQPGQRWPTGGQRQPSGSYIAGAPQPTGDYSFGYQSMTGGLQQDGQDSASYQGNGAFTIVQDAWLLGPGTLLGAQHSHDHRIERAKVVFTSRTRDGVTDFTGIHAWVCTCRTTTARWSCKGSSCGPGTASRTASLSGPWTPRNTRKGSARPTPIRP
ncbi:hypothetical protein ACFSC4_00180 [Deinococcus malanensis]|uniref:hypothetical protein n=1 Tax=Deinococcus malanensis TaxID=1706855 RepID=UPI0036351FF9